LERAKKEAEQTVQNLKTKMTSADGKTNDLVDSMRKIQHEQKETRYNLQKERMLREQKHDYARQIEERLRRKVEELTKEMAKAEEQSRLKVVAERGLRIKTEKELTGENRRNKELNGVLRETEKHLESLKRSHMQFRIGLLQAMGTDDSRVRKNDDELHNSDVSLSLGSI
jgi:chromosome segregation ATPase